MSTPVFAVIQSRLSSSRLPGKALLQVAGMPTAVLCAKRISNTGIPYVVATSTDKSDDPLVRALEYATIPFFRGSLLDVLQRFVDATAHIKDENTIILRLTADNLLPDGAFLEKFIKLFVCSNAISLATGKRLPYGLSAQACRLTHLREAAREATLFSDRDNVFPYIDRLYGVEYFNDFDQVSDYGHLRVTLDTFDDFLNISRVFNESDCPITVDAHALVNLFSKLENVSTTGVPYKKKGGFISRLSLGTAQLGRSYGVANRVGQPSETAAYDLLACAHKHNIRLYDTAASYGQSEDLLGSYFSKHRNGLEMIVTKLSTLSELSVDMSSEQVVALVESSVYASCWKLKVPALDCLLLHRWEHFSYCNGLIWQCLLDLKSRGVINRLGASVTSPSEAVEALASPEIEFLQLPFNCLDWRWGQSEVLDALNARPDVIVQARSALLQGLLVLEPALWPKIEGIDAYALLRRLDALVHQFNRKNIQDLCYAYCLSHSWIDTVLVGVETVEQLTENINLFSGMPLTMDEQAAVRSAVGYAPVQLLDPSRWPDAIVGMQQQEKNSVG